MAEEPPIALSVLTVHGDTESTSHDIHLARAPSASGGAADPLFLRDLLTTKADIDVIRQRPRTTRGKGKQVVEFYENQNDHILSLLKPMEMHTSEAADAAEESALKVKIAVYASFYANCALAILQLYAAVSSLSLSLFATAIDSVFDPAANGVLNWLHKKGQTADPVKWPQGGSRFETIGNCVYGFLMGTVNLILIVESIRTVATHSSEEETNAIHIPALAAVGVAFFVKLSLFFYCLGVRNNSSQVQVLWEDHRNDLLINGFGILTSAGGAKLKWWIDPAGAMIIAVIVIASWTRTVYSQFTLLAGKSADPKYLQLVIYKAMTFSPLIKQIDSCRVYHSGPDYIIEVDVVMDSMTPLWQTHDISQALQDKLELMPGVDRAFVHCDHETSHAPEHSKKDK